MLFRSEWPASSLAQAAAAVVGCRSRSPLRSYACDAIRDPCERVQSRPPLGSLVFDGVAGCVMYSIRYWPANIRQRECVEQLCGTAAVRWQSSILVSALVLLVGPWAAL